MRSAGCRQHSLLRQPQGRESISEKTFLREKSKFLLTRDSYANWLPYMGYCVVKLGRLRPQQNRDNRRATYTYFNIIG